MTRKAKRPVAPKGLGAAGKRTWRAILADLPADEELTARELELLATAARQADLVAALEKALVAEGVIVAGAAGQKRLNAVTTELRQSRLAFARLLGELAISPDEGEIPMTSKAQRAQRAAQARWRRRYGQRAA